MIGREQTLGHDPKAAKNPNSRLRQARKRWRC